MSSIVIEDEALVLIKEGVEIKRKALERSLKRYEREIKEYEKKYQMSSSEFENKFESGQMGDDPRWFRWSFLNEAYKKTMGNTVA